MFRLSFIILFFIVDSAIAQRQTQPQPKTRKKQGLQQVRPKQQKIRPNVRKQFQKAQKLFAKERYNEAILAYDRILRVYPNHQPSLMQMGKSLYRLDRIPEAYRLFSRINPVGLDVTTSYEYGLSHFWMRQYQPALYGFQRIPDGHALSDLANYYGGISALKLRRLVEAEQMMEKAVVLPDKLARSRKKYLRHIHALKLIYEKKGLAKERKREREKVEKAIANSDKKTHKQLEKEGPPKEYVHRGFQKVKQEPLLGGTYKHQVSDQHGFGEDIAIIRTSFLQLKAGPLIPLPIFKRGADRAALGLQLKLRGEEQTFDGQERRNIQSDDIDAIQRIVTRTPETTHTKFGEGEAKLWFETPAPLGVWLSTGGLYSQRYPDFERTEMSGKRSGFLLIGGKDATNEYSSEYTYTEIFNADLERTIALNQIDVTWGIQAIVWLYIELEITNDHYIYEDLPIDGPTSATSGSVDVQNDLPWGFALGAKTSVLFQSEYIVHDLPTFGDVSADGITYTGKVYLKANPVDWFKLQISEQVQKTNWTVTPEDAQETFEKNQYDFQETFEAKASINLLF